jgi:hypothetical protein
MAAVTADLNESGALVKERVARAVREITALRHQRCDGRGGLLEVATGDGFSSSSSSLTIGGSSAFPTCAHCERSGVCRHHHHPRLHQQQGLAPCHEHINSDSNSSRSQSQQQQQGLSRSRSDDRSVSPQPLCTPSSWRQQQVSGPRGPGASHHLPMASSSWAPPREGGTNDDSDRIVISGTEFLECFPLVFPLGKRPARLPFV